jgi:hypothetical protein
MNQNSTKPGTAEGAGRHTPGRLRHVPEVLLDGMHVAGREPKIVEDSTGIIIAEVSRHTPARGREDEAEYRARRIVAAWNAVAGITTEALETGAVADLLEACRMVEEQIISHMAGAWPGTMSITAKRVSEALRAAIAKATGRTHQ